jgi:hypothetical protein
VRESRVDFRSCLAQWRASNGDSIQGSVSGDPLDRQRRLQNVLSFWNALSCREDAGETTSGVLEELQAQVTDCLSRELVDLAQVESLTAEAALRLTGQLLV